MIVTVQDAKEILFRKKQRASDKLPSAPVAIGTIIPSPVRAVMIRFPPIPIATPAFFAHHDWPAQGDMIIHPHRSKDAIRLNDGNSVSFGFNLI